MSTPRIAIIIYSLFGHIEKMAQEEKAGIEARGGSAVIYQVPETLSPEILAKMHAPDKIDYPIATPQTLVEHDAFLFGVPTRYGNMPAQFKSLWDATGQIWVQGALAGKYAGLFVSTGSPGGGQEMTISNYLSTLTHHGILFVPFGYATGLQRLISLEEVHGGSPWGAGTYSAPDGSRKPTEREVEIAQAQGGAFYDIVSRVKWN